MSIYWWTWEQKPFYKTEQFFGLHGVEKYHQFNIGFLCFVWRTK